MKYRKLRSDEISLLQSNGCRSDSWENIDVVDDFQPGNIRNIQFEGNIRLGRFDGKIELEPGLVRTCGLYDSYISDCTIGDSVYIAGVGNLFRYRIGNDVVIENSGFVGVTGTTTFGNGRHIIVLNEAGGRELIMYEELTAQIAYIMVTCRHDEKLIERLSTLIDIYASGKKSSIGIIETGVRIRNCTEIRNVAIGRNVRLTGTALLEEGTLAGSSEDPVVIGSGVTMKTFIVQSGTVIESGALLSDCFVGQGVRMGKQISAENSAFFANAEGFHSEVCSVFAGPYSVTHHRSTLLIAGMFSFYNAGSGTNQSNHMYKLGPVHQGILERGAKTGSFSYLLWPTRVGAFSAVIGKHNTNFDSSEFPFSYIHEEEGKSVLTPAMNLFSAGTHRDGMKWPHRDRRKDPVKHDLIHFELFNPYTIGKVLNAQKILHNLGSAASKEQEFINYKGIAIKRLLIKTVIKYYELSVQIYTGNMLVRRLERGERFRSISDIGHFLSYDANDYHPEWIDASGMFMPKAAYDNLLESVKNGTIGSVSDLFGHLLQIYSAYDRMTWAWCAALIEKRHSLRIGTVQKTQLLRIIHDWRDASLKLNNMIANDAAKEFDTTSRIGFGIDGDESVRDMDFNAVRGTFDKNSFIIQLTHEADTIRRQAGELIQSLEAIG
jgi:hypothetical protein